jgi:hypothetical protein
VTTSKPTLRKALDAAIAAENAAYLADTDLQEQDRIAGTRFMRLVAAEEAVGFMGVVLPIPLAREILWAMAGQNTLIGKDTLILMLQGHLDRAKERS